MIVDSSALVAILCRDPLADRLRAALAAEDASAISAASYLETSVVIDNRASAELSAGLDHLLRDYGIQIVPVTADQARIARSAYREFGKGAGHQAQLNLATALPTPSPASKTTPCSSLATTSFTPTYARR